MPKRTIKPDDKITKQIYDKLFQKDINTNKEREVKEKFEAYVLNEFRVNEKFDSISVALHTKDCEKIHWQKNQHFTKTFHFEFRHCEEYYSLTKGEKNFLISTSEYLKWESNVLVDEFDIPLNQKSLAKLLEITTKTVWANMKALEEKHLVKIINIEQSIYYIINPFLIYKGQNINISLPKLFVDKGYIDSSKLDKATRSNRRKEQQKRIDAG